MSDKNPSVALSTERARRALLRASRHRSMAAHEVDVALRELREMSAATCYPPRDLQPFMVPFWSEAEKLAVHASQALTDVDDSMIRLVVVLLPALVRSERKAKEAK